MKRLTHTLRALKFLPLAAVIFSIATLHVACQSSTADESIVAESSPRAEPEAVIDTRDDDLDDREAALEERQAELLAQQTELDAQQAELEAEREALEAREARLERRDREVSRQLATLDDRLAELEREREDQAPAPTPEPARDAPAEAEPAPEPPRPVIVTVPAGTPVEVEFIDNLSSLDSRPGDTFRTRVLNDVFVGERVAIPAGSEILGTVTEAVPLGKKIGGQARLAVRFTDLVPPGGGAVAIEASYAELGRNEKKRDAATIGGAAAGGAILGRVIDDDDRGRGTLLGAILGAAAGTAIASKSGQEVEIADGTWARLELEAPVEIKLGDDR